MSTNSFQVVINSFQKGIKPKKIMTVSQWADENRILPTKTSAEAGRWRTARTPYLREIMDELSHMSRTKKVIFMKGAQVGATEAGNNWLGYIIDQDPATVMVIWPSLPDVMTNTKLRITPLIESTPCLRDKVKDSKGRESGSSARFKNFDGGAMILSGANSASSLRSIPAKFAFMDECDGYVKNVEGEGDPITLVLVRSRTFNRRKAFIVSTPTVKGSSRIEREFKTSDQRYYYVPCPHCKEKQILNFDNLSYEIDPEATITEDDGTEYPLVISASYFCEKCGEQISEHNKTWMLKNGDWIKHNPRSATSGFHLSALYSPLGWYSWLEIMQDFVKAENDPDLMRTFVNTVKGESFEAAGESPQYESLYKRREDYAIGTVQRGVYFLTASCDVQKDRLEVEVMGWGKGKERWSIEHKVIAGQVNEEETWDKLEEYLASSFDHVDGYSLPIMMAAIDSGYETSRVYEFCNRYSTGKVYAIKGRDDLNVMIGTPTAVDTKSKKTGKKIRRGVRLWPIGTSVTKTEIYGDLMLAVPEDEDLEKMGYPKGFIHFPQYDLEYFRQLTAEKKIYEKDKYGKVKGKWSKHYERNEILDLYVYNRAMAQLVGIERLNESGWDRLESQQKLAKNLLSKDNINQDRITRKEKKKKRKKKDTYWDD